MVERITNGDVQLKELQTGLVIRAHMTGSRYIGGAKEDSDYDVLVHVEGGALYEYADTLRAAGWDVSVDDPEYMGEDNHEWEFITARSEQDGQVWNLICYDDPGCAYSWWRATEFAKRMNLTSKSDRGELFSIVMGMRATHGKNLDPAAGG